MLPLRKSMKDQIPYVTQLRELRDEFRLVFTQAIPTHASGWLAQRSGLGYGIWGKYRCLSRRNFIPACFFLFHFSIFPGIRHFSTLDKIGALIDKLSVFYVACSFGTTVFVYTTNNLQ